MKFEIKEIKGEIENPSNKGVRLFYLATDMAEG
jgi:hypothetical protein